MSDRRLRELERRLLETGSEEDRKAYIIARKRAGLPDLPREVVRHYIDDGYHGHLGADGKFIVADIGRQGLVRPMRVTSRCSVELWPRETDDGWCRRWKKVFCTEDPTEVTCKTCLKSLNKPDQRIRRRVHYAPCSKVSATPPVCGRNDSDSFQESFSWTMRDVTCPVCKRIMAGGRRSPRSPRVKGTT